MSVRPDEPTSTDSAADAEENRRRFARTEYQVEVSLESESTFYNGFTENISAGGLFIATHDTRPMGEVIEMSFTIPGRKDPIAVQGEVRWLREYREDNTDMVPGMGVNFINLSESDKRDIEKFITSRAPEFFDTDL